MPSQISIVNRALRRVGEATKVAAMTDNTQAARLASDVWDDVQFEMLGKHPWSFTLKTSGTLANLAQYDPDFEFVHQLPADCLKVLRIAADGVEYDDDGVATYGTFPPTDDDQKFAIRSNALASNVEEPIILYQWKNLDMATYTPAFVEAWVSALAVEFSYALTTKTTLLDVLMQDAHRKLKIAKAEDAQRNRLSNDRMGQSFVNARNQESRS